MERIYIPIGAQCTTPTLFNRLQLKKESLPFDWMFSTPEFVFTILKLLLIDNIDINEIVDNHFFICDNRAILQGVEKHITNMSGNVLVNSKYNVCFPHDTITDRDKYVRRIERLKNIILNTNNFIYFVYVSVSSPDRGNYTLDGIEPIQHLYDYIEKINNMIKHIRSNYKILVFDTNKSPTVSSSDNSHMFFYKLSKKNTWGELLPELIDKFNTIS